MNLGEPIVLVVFPATCAPFLGVVVGESELGIVVLEHGALLKGVLHQALVVRVGLLEHIVEEPRTSGASGILAICGHD